MNLLFAHGWALDRTLWNGVLAALGEQASGAVVLDTGYYGAPSPPPLLHGPVLGVGQSLGALELMARPPMLLAGIVVLDGFARFGQADDFTQGVSARVLARMRKRVADGALVEFLARAGGSVPEGTPDTSRLVEGLDRLGTLDGRGCALPLWRLHGEGDPIATPSAADASFDGMDVVERRIRPSTDHLSPLHAPQACADLIRVALKALA